LTAAGRAGKDEHVAHVSTQALDLSTTTPFGISRWTRGGFERFVVELRDHDRVGIGEAAPNARYGEDRERDRDLLQDWAPEIADLEGPAGVEAFCEALGAAVPALRAGLSAAAWDLAGKQASEPVWRMLGLARPSVRTSFTVSVGPPEEMLAQARAAAGRFAALKVKLGFPGDLEVARRLRHELPGVTFRYDVNEGWDRERAAAGLAVLEDLHAEFVEQPLPAADTEGMVWLKERTRVPLLADEAVLSLEDLDAVGEAYDGVVVKLAKVGGIAAAFALVSACTELGMRVLMGCMIESSLGIAAALQLAGLADWVDLDGALLLAHDPFTGVQVDGDLLTASDEPGLGVRPAR
jgi:L-alanine-DL-glutamate epimerase-like enolase superfamily enzyme